MTVIAICVLTKCLSHKIISSTSRK